MESLVTAAHGWAGRRVLVTGHTGFKGSVARSVAARDGQRCTGYALDPPTEPSLFEAARIGAALAGDARAIFAISPRSAVAAPCPAGGHVSISPPSRLVRLSYAMPVETFDDKRDGHGQCSSERCPRRLGAGRGDCHQRQMLREPRQGRALPRERPDGRRTIPTAAARAAPSSSSALSAPAPMLSVRKARFPRSRRFDRATSSAVVTGRRIVWYLTACGHLSPASR